MTPNRGMEAIVLKACLPLHWTWWVQLSYPFWKKASYVEVRMERKRGKKCAWLSGFLGFTDDGTGNGNICIHTHFATKLLNSRCLAFNWLIIYCLLILRSKDFCKLYTRIKWKDVFVCGYMGFFSLFVAKKRSDCIMAT